MDLRQLEIFVCVADTGSFSRTAEQLFITQPTVSAHIRQLETELGVELFLRSTRSLRISEAGERLYPYALTMLDLRTRAQRELNDLAAGRKVIRVGASSIPSAYILPTVLAQYGQRNPDLYFEVDMADSQSVVERVARGDLDVGLVGANIPSASCIYSSFDFDELVVAAPNTEYYRNLKQKDASLHELMREPVLLREPSSGTRLETEKVLHEAGISMESLHISAVFNDPEAIRNSIVQGFGVSMMSRRSVQDLADAGKLILFDLKEASAIRQLFVVRRSDIPVSPEVAAFISYLSEMKHG